MSKTVFVPPGPHELVPPSGATLLVGRSDAAGIVVQDPLVSTFHAAIIPQEGRWQLRDLGSRNGTFVNEARVAEVFLGKGDLLRIGSTSFRFEPEGGVRVAARASLLDARSTLGVPLSDGKDDSVSTTLKEPRAVAALLALAHQVDVAPTRAELTPKALEMLAELGRARAASLWSTSGPELAREAVHGEERAKRALVEELVALAAARRQATTASMGDAGFAAAIPLVARTSQVGAVIVERGTAFAKRELELLSIFTRKLALALENELLTEELLKTNAHLEAEVARRTADVVRLSEQRRDLLGMVAHDVRGALTFVKLLADPQAAEADGARDPVALEALSQIALRADKTIDLLASLLDTEAVEEGRIELRLEAVDLVALARGLTAPLRRWAESRKLALELEATASVVARADPARFEQVIQNLVANAIKNTSQGKISIAIEAVSDRARVSVRDTGRGIPAEVLASIWKPVRREEAGRARVGLGLAIAHRLVSLMGGELTVESELGKGTRFRFDLPLAL